MERNTNPEVPTYVERNERYGTYALFITCPHCGDLHSHGGGKLDGPPDFGHRVSHCVHAECQGYYLVPGPEGMAKPKALTQREQRKRLRERDGPHGGKLATLAQIETARQERTFKRRLIKSLKEPVPSGAGY